MAGSAAPDVAKLPVRPGEVLDGRFRIDSVIGVGGMGAVYAATHVQLGQRVAIKVIVPTGDKDEANRHERLLHEARIVAQMKSPHVTSVIDVGTLESGWPYMVMEMLEGVDLDQHLEERFSLAAGDAVDFVLQVCEAVAEAHSLGIIHRDLKPSNMFLTKDVDKRPLVKVLDFGLAKSVREQSGHGPASITRPLEIIGTPSYMSPEQLRATSDVDERTDIWSLGIILYELLAGRVPFDSPSIPDLCAAIVRDPPPPLMAPLPEGLEAVIQKCLQKYPKDRYPRITELAEALAPYSTNPQRIERVRRVQRQDTLPPEAPFEMEISPLSGPLSSPMSRRRQADIETQVVSRRGDATLGARPGMRGLGIALIVLLIAGMGGAAVFIAIRLGDTPAKTGNRGPTSSVVLPIPAPSPTAAEPAAPAVAFTTVSPNPTSGPSSGPTAAASASAAAKPRKGARPTSTAAASASSTPPPSPPAPEDPEKLFQSR